MTSRQVSLAIVATVAIAFPTPQASAQCEPTWGLDLLPTTGLRGYISVMSTCDIGNGPSLYAAGVQLTMNSIDFNGVAVFNGAEWKTLGAGVGGTIQAMLPFNDGSGTALYVGGAIWLADGAPVITLARWNGNTWFGIPGVPGTVTALGIHADESGPALYAACVVSTTGPAITQIARWNGSSWSAVGSNIAVSIRALQSFDDGHGQALFAAGYRVGGTGATFPIMFRWDGQSWLQTTNESDHPSDGTILSASFNALQVFDDGSGPALYAAGWFSWSGQKPIRGIARWSGTDWFAVGTGIEGSVQALASIHDSLGSGLCAAGSIRVPGSPTSDYVLRWDGTTWTPVAQNPPGTPYALAVLDLGRGESLCAGLSNGTGVVRLQSGTWSSLASGHGGILGNPASAFVGAMARFNDGSGEAIYVGGAFSQAGGIQTRAIAKWDGERFSAVGGGISGVVDALKSFDDGTGSALYAAGNFSIAGGVAAKNIARWNGKTWSPLGAGVGGVDDQILALEVFDDGSGPALYAGGYFETAGGMKAKNIAMWTGAEWSALDNGVDGPVAAIRTVHESGASALFVGGFFYSAGNISTEGIARWNGASWSDVGGGLEINEYGWASTMLEYDDGSGMAVYVGGYFTAAGETPARNIARWNGQSWSPLGQGLGWAPPRDFAVFDDGSGPALFAAGTFEAAGGANASQLAKWNGKAWQSVGTGVYFNSYDPDASATTVWSILPFNDGHGPALFIGGHFNAVDGHFFRNIARLVRAAPNSPTILFASQPPPACAGGHVMMTVEATGAGPLTYQWRKFSVDLQDNATVSGSRTPTLTLSSLSASQAVPFSCVIADAGCNVVSATAYLDVTPAPPLITHQPARQTAHVGSIVSFFINVEPYWAASYQWRKGGIALEASSHLSGITSSQLTIANVSLADAGLYDCVITNPCGTTTSNPARLTVLASVPPPAKPIGPIPANPG